MAFGAGGGGGGFGSGSGGFGSGSGGGASSSASGSQNLKEVGHIRNVFPETWLWTNSTIGYIDHKNVISCQGHSSR